MIEELWHAVIEFSQSIVVPDWGALVALIPLGLAALVGLYLAWAVARLVTAGPTRRGVRRLEPAPPAGVHMPGGSFAPILGAIGTFLLFFGLIAGGIATWLGIGGLVLALLYWGREALADYDHIPDVAAELGTSRALVPLTAERTPPPGIHMPPPSFLPLLGAIGTFFLVLGVVVGGWFALAGVLVLVLGLVGWMRDARREYRATELADVTGHLDLGGAPRWPVATFVAIAAIVVAGAILSSGILPNSASATAAPAPSGEVPGGGAPGSEPPAESPPPAVEADVVAVAQGIQWVERTLTAPADTPFTLALDNRDAGVPHDVVIKDAAGTELWRTDTFPGVEARVFEADPLAAGSYPFVCSVHPNMTGTLEVG